MDRGHPYRIEDFLAKRPEADIHLLLPELIAIELHYQGKRGEPVSISDYIRRFPMIDRASIECRSGQNESFPRIDGDSRTSGPRSDVHLSPSTAASIGDYVLLEQVAKGGMGVVYRAYHKKLDRIVALKMISSVATPSPTETQRFLSEAQASAKLDHPGIVPIYEFGIHQNSPFFTMAFVEGSTLAEKLQNTPASPVYAASVGKSIAVAIHYAHQQGIIHRDLKPSNILIDAHDTAKISDFGLAKRLSDASSTTQTGQVLGTASYMPPEQARGDTRKVSPSSDVYSIGAILYYMTTGRPPFQAASCIETLRQVVECDPIAPQELNPAIPKDLQTIILKSLQKSPSARYWTALELAEDLDRYLAGKPPLAKPTSQAERAVRWCLRNKAIASLLATIFIVLLAGVILSSFFAMIANQRSQSLAQRTAIANAKTTEAQRHLYAARMSLVRANFESNNLGAAIELLAHYQSDRIEGNLADFEWFYWYRKCHAYALSLRVVSFGIRSVAFSPDGKRFASANESQMGEVGIRDGRTGALLQTIQVCDPADADELTSVAFSADGTKLTIANGFKATVWSLSTAKQELILPEQPQRICGLAYTPDGKNIAIGIPGSVQIFDSVDGRVLLSLGESKNQEVLFHPDYGLGPNGLRISQHRSIAIDPTGTILATTCIGDIPSLWNLRTGKKISSFPEPACVSLAFSPDGTRFAAVGKSLFLWNVTTGELLLSKSAPTATFTDIAFHPDGDVLATAGKDHTIRFWDLPSGNPQGTYVGHLGEVNCLEFSPDGSQLLSASDDGTVKLWNASLDDPPQLANLQKDAPTFEILDDYKQVLLTTANHQFTLEHNRIQDVLMSPDHRRLVTFGVVQNQQFETRLWDVATGKLVASIKEIVDEPMPIASDDQEPLKLVMVDEYDESKGFFSQDGELLAILSTPILLVDCNRGDLLRRISLPSETQVCDISISPNKRYLAAGTTEGEALVWDIEKGTLLNRWKEHRSSAYRIAFSPDSKWLCSGGLDNLIVVYDIRDNKVSSRWNAHTQPLRIPFTSSSGTLWESGRVHQIDFSPRGSRLVSAGADGFVKLWEPSTGQETLRATGEAFQFDESGEILYVAPEASLDARRLTERISDDAEAISFLAFLSKNVEPAEWPNVIQNDLTLRETVRNKVKALLKNPQ